MREEIKGYLTAEEQKMPLECMLLQSVMGIQTCKNKGEVKDILLQIYLIGQNRAIKKAKEEVLEELKEPCDVCGGDTKSICKIECYCKSLENHHITQEEYNQVLNKRYSKELKIKEE